MNSRRIHHFLATTFPPQIPDRFYRTDPHTAVEPAFEAIATSCKEVTGPAIQAHAIDGIVSALSRLEIVFPTGIVRIADSAVTVTIVDPMLAPDLPLAHVNALIAGQQSLVFCIHESSDQALRTITTPDHVFNQSESFVDIPPGPRDCCTWARNIRRD